MGNTKLNIILFIVLIIAFIVILNLFLIKPKSATQLNSVSINISTNEGAIEYAKKDRDFIAAVNEFKSYGNLKYQAYIQTDGNWYVSTWPEGTADLWYYLKLDNKGNIIEKGYGQGG